MSAAVVVLGFSALIYELGVGPALIQRPEVTNAHIKAGLTGSVSLSLLLGGAVALGAPIIAAAFDIDGLTPVLQVIALEFPFQGISTVARSMMQRELRFRELAIIEISAYAVGYGIVGVTLAATGAGVWALVGAHLMRSVISTIALLATGRYGLRPGFNLTAFRELLVFGGGFTVAHGFNYLARQGDNFVAARWLGAAALGAYGRAYQLVGFPVNQLTMVIGEVLFPAMARIQKSKERLSATFRRGTSVMALAFAPIGIIAAVLAPEIIGVTLGSGWSEAVPPFQILAVGMVFRASYKVSDVLAKAVGAVYRRAWRQAVYAISVVAGSWIGQHWGLTGLSLGVLGSLVVNFALMSHLSVSLTYLTWRQFFRAHIPAFGIAALAFAMTFGMASWLRSLETPDLVLLLVTVLVNIGVIGLLTSIRPSALGLDHAWIAATAKEVLLRLRPDSMSTHKESTAKSSEHEKNA